MNLEQVANTVISNLQLILDGQGWPLAVGPLTEGDYQALSTMFAELNWDYAFSAFGNREDKFEFTVKLLPHSGGLPAGAAMCVYNVETNSFDIQFVESFVRNVSDHPLHGKMMKITVLAAYLFCSMVDCPTVHVIEPDTQELMDIYRTFGFEGDAVLMSASIATIEAVIMSYT